MTDCEEVKKISRYIKRWISKQPTVKEESLTDWLLFDMKEKIPRLIYKPFTRHEEAINGADWEWWILFPKKFYRLRIQAKKCFYSRNGIAKYKKPNVSYNNRQQINKLIADSSTTNSIPLYAFYTSEAGKTMCKLPINYEGVYLADARNVYNTFNSIATKNVLSISNPLSCLFCCSCANKNNTKTSKNFSEDNITSFLKRLRVEDISNGTHETIPKYVSNLLNTQGDIDNWYEKEFKDNIKDISAIMIYDARPE